MSVGGRTSLYLGEVDAAGVVTLWREGRPSAARRRVAAVVRHSPDGPAWGYAGAGPADCALSILVDAAGNRAAIEDLYVPFMRQHLASTCGHRFELRVAEVGQWLEAHGVVPAGIYPHRVDVHRLADDRFVVSVGDQVVAAVEVDDVAPARLGHRFVEITDRCDGRRLGLFDPRPPHSSPHLEAVRDGYAADSQRWAVTVDGEPVAGIDLPPSGGLDHVEVRLTAPAGWPRVRAPTRIHERLMQLRAAPAIGGRSL